MHPPCLLTAAGKVMLVFLDKTKTERSMMYKHTSFKSNT